MSYNIFIFILFYSIAVVPCIGMYNKALILQYPFSSFAKTIDPPKNEEGLGEGCKVYTKVEDVS